MRVEVRPINQKGKLLKKVDRLSTPPCRGELKVLENRLHHLGRAATCARAVSTADGLETDLLPELVDAAILWVDEKTIRLRGTEVIDDVQYSQTWDIMVLSC
jgi:hypothetical protein